MADCSNTPTPESTSDFHLNTECFKEVLTSNADYTTAKASDGNVKKTIAAALRDAGLEHLGEWSTNPLVESANQVIPYAGTNQLFRPLSLPYQVDSASHPDPNALLPDPSTGYAGELRDVSKFADYEDITEAQNDIVGGSIFKGSNGEYVQNDDIVPSGTTHLQVIIDGNTTIVAMSESATGSVSGLMEKYATIGGTLVSFAKLGFKLSDPEAWFADTKGVELCDREFALAASFGMLQSKEGNKFRLSQQLNTDNGWDLKNVTIVIDKEFTPAGAWGTGSVIKWTDPEEIVTEQLNATVSKGEKFIPWLTSYSNHVVYVKSRTEIIHERSVGGGLQNIYKQDVWLVKNGNIQNTPSWWDLNSDLDLVIKPIKFGLTVNNPNFEIPDELTTSKLPSLLQVERCSVECVGGGIDISHLNAALEQQILSIVRYEKTAENHIRNQHSNTLDKDFCYPIYFVNCANNTVDNCSDPNSWALVDGQVMRNTKVKNVFGSRVGWHYMSEGFTIDNYKTTKKGIYPGTGWGVLAIKDYDFTIDYNAPEIYRRAIGLRSDYGSIFSGLIDWKTGNVTQIGVATNSTSGTAPSLVGMSFSSEATTNETIKLPNILLSDVDILQPTGVGSHADILTFSISGTTNNDVVVMDSVKIDSVNIIDNTEKQRLKYADFPVFKDSNYSGSVNIEVKNGKRTRSSAGSLDQRISNADKALVTVDVHRTYINHDRLSMITSLPSSWSTTIKGGSCSLKNGLSNDGDDSLTLMQGVELIGDNYTSNPGSVMKLINCDRTKIGGTLTLSKGLVLSHGNTVDPTVTFAGVNDNNTNWDAGLFFNYKSALKYA